MPGWLPFDDTRCLWFSEEKLTRRKAEEQCRSFGHRGTLVEIHSAQDQERVREIRSGKGWKYTHAVWLSGEIKQWDFTGSHEILPFQNFSKADTANMCVRMIAEYYPDRGGWKMVPCDGANKELYICQMEKMGRPPCEDSRYNCEDTLTIYPGWCRDQRSKDNAKIYCAKTCGFCKDPLTCPTPEPADTYSVTSSDLDVHLGDVMTFQCNPDLYHVGGDLHRACGPEGKLLGVEPECASSPKPVDVNKHRVRKRPAGLDKQTGFLLDKKGYRVPFKGKITRWYYMAKNGGELDFVVFRRNARGSQGPPYVYVGSNKVSAEANWIFGFEVPADEQISVQRGDVIGVYSQAKDILYINKCKNKKQKLMNLPVTRAPNFQIIARTRGVFHPRRRECLVPSVGFRVEPT
ncbi:uncharacterized protein LOC101845349 [Aplysia californica]|uniref:Uncharacterized protein LOC101845349 n=1 Tax=Aplysia californica TaxID=6500 RepID=A0ABM1A5M3_APLCA|nr:uncharacterized protein LOC101845349 [Aplysia californica]